MRKFISGTIVGALLASTVAFAASYVAEPATFKVMVNGKEFNSDPPALVVENRTYLPLRAMGDALGVPVEWNAELNQAEVGTTPSAPIANGNYSRTNPAPINTIQYYERNQEYSSSNYSANIRISQVIRGDQANAMIKSANMFNSEPDNGYEYIIAKVAFSLLTSQDDKAVSASSYNFKFYSGNNEEYKSPLVVLDDKLEKDLYVGGNADGYIVGMIKKDDPAPKVAYGLDYSGLNGIWFSLQ
jgi:hypothetical protein